jgi:hypothetical protein
MAMATDIGQIWTITTTDGTAVPAIVTVGTALAATADGTGVSGSSLFYWSPPKDIVEPLPIIFDWGKAWDKHFKQLKYYLDEQLYLDFPEEYYDE